MNEFLDTDEIVRLTGKKRKDEQKNWLIEKGYIFELNAANEPIVNRFYCRNRLSGTKIEIPCTQPNFRAINEKAAI